MLIISCRYSLTFSLLAGFSFDVAVSANTKPTSPQHENSSPTDSFSPDSMSNADKSERTFTKGISAFETDSLYTHSEDESKSPRSSPARQTASESPSHDYSDNHFGKIFEADTESHRYRFAMKIPCFVISGFLFFFMGF